MRAAELLNEVVGKNALRRGTGGGVNSAQTEAIFVGLMRRLTVQQISPDEVKAKYDRILSMEKFLNSTETGTSAPGSVKMRFSTAIEEFKQQ